MKSLARDLTTRAQRWYATRPARDRKALQLMAAFIALVTAIGLLDWSHRTQSQLSHKLPVLTAEFDRLQSDATELTRLRGLPQRTAPPPAAIIETLRSAASARGMALDIRVSGDALQASGNATLPALIDWLGAVQADHGLYPSSLTFKGDGTLLLTLRGSGGNT